MSMFMSNVISTTHNSSDQCMYIYQRLCTCSCELLLCCDLLLHCHTIVCRELWTWSNMCHQCKHVSKQPTHTPPVTTNIRCKNPNQLQTHVKHSNHAHQSNRMHLLIKNVCCADVLNVHVLCVVGFQLCVWPNLNKKHIMQTMLHYN